MIWILLATLGIPIWLIVGALIATWQTRRTVKRQAADAVGRLVTFEDGTQREIAVAANHVSELDRTARPTRH